jgi:uncharacterized protein YndB with AHSA1/START domain
MSISTISVPPDDPTITVERLFDAPRALIFRLVTDPYHLAQFLGPHGVVNDIREMDVRPGGYWENIMRFPDGSEDRVTGVFIEAIEPERLVWRDAPHGSREPLSSLPPARLVTTLLFDDVAGRTKITAQVRATTIALRNGALSFVQGMSQGNEKLAAYIGGLDRA